MFHRTDLANIVRRRGYKLIRDLLSNSTKEDTDGSNLEKSLAEGHNAISDSADISTGQYMVLLSMLGFLF